MNPVVVSEEGRVLVARGDVAHSMAVGPVSQRDYADVEGVPVWRARERIAARALLRQLLLVAAPDAAMTPLGADARGRPTLQDRPYIGVSLSHDGEHVAAAVGLGVPVGVDVQMPPRSLDDTLLDRCVRKGRSELLALDDASRRIEFAWIWTVQEACVKADGSGLAGRPWMIDVLPGASSGRWREFRWVSLRDESATPLSYAYADPVAGKEPSATEDW